MGFAIITEKNANNKVNIKATSPLTNELKKQAEALDKYLEAEIPKLIMKLKTEGLLTETTGKNKSKEGSVELWYSLGSKLRAICKYSGINGKRERRWLWEALVNIYPTEPIRRATRGKGRIHFEYCYRLSYFAIEFARQINWSEWVYYFDSKTVREDQRIDDWLRTAVEQDKKINRYTFRKFVQNLNKRVRNIDTSELRSEELFEIYDSIWSKTGNDLQKIYGKADSSF
jgi:hypothetical protein